MPGELAALAVVAVVVLAELVALVVAVVVVTDERVAAVATLAGGTVASHTHWEIVVVQDVDDCQPAGSRGVGAGSEPSRSQPPGGEAGLLWQMERQPQHSAAQSGSARCETLATEDQLQFEGTPASSSAFCHFVMSVKVEPWQR